ncbi:MAG: AbrB/MazE/SpoVT family DNA-binding domain-containing protein [Methylococcales bacterium]
MRIAIVSAQGHVPIPADIRQKLGIIPGSRLAFTVEGSTIRIERTAIKPSRPEDGYGMLRCVKPGERHLSDFDIAQAIREDDRA